MILLGKRMIDAWNRLFTQHYVKTRCEAVLRSVIQDMLPSNWKAELSIIDEMVEIRAYIPDSMSRDDGFFVYANLDNFVTVSKEFCNEVKEYERSRVL